MRSTSTSIPVIGALAWALGACGASQGPADRNMTVEKRPATVATAPTHSDRHGLPVAAPADVEIPDAAIAGIRSRAKQERTSALVILRDGKLVVEDYFGGRNQPLVAMSATKSVAALAIAHLSEAGRLDLDKPLTQIFPEWDDGNFDPITVRHLLNHTSGLATGGPTSGTGTSSTTR